MESGLTLTAVISIGVSRDGGIAIVRKCWKKRWNDTLEYALLVAFH